MRALSTFTLCLGLTACGFEASSTPDADLSHDAIVPDASMPDASVPDALACGDGQHGDQVCDGTDLAGEDCASQGFPGGTLACNDACTAFDVSNCTAPGIPTLRRPFDGAYVGTLGTAGSLRPSFTWTAVTWAGTGTIGYELDLSTDATFATAVMTIPTAATTYQPPADLAISGTAPVGARYYWRVRACSAGVCSAPTSAWRVNVGRSDRDFNGDGYADVVVGAIGNAGTGTGIGHAYLYFGGAGAFDTTVDTTLTGAAALDYFGVVATAGDVNADGFADLVVGASSDGTTADPGHAYVYLGGAGTTFDTTADGVLTGVAAGDGFGNAVGGAGDVNHDGFADVVVGAPLSDAGGADGGMAYVYFGGAGATFDSTVDATLAPAAAGDQFGKAVGSAGDVNGDGFADVIVGAWLNAFVGTQGGRAYVYLGGSGTFDATADGILTGAATGDNLGISVASAGDVNADGYADVVVGAYSNDAGGSNAGRAYLFRGGPGASFDNTADATLTGQAASNFFGADVATAGDVNGDGFDDVVVGAPGAGNTGAAYVYLGSAATFDTTSDGIVPGFLTSSQFGSSVATAGDVDADGFDDVVVGAPYGGTNGTYSGAAHVFRGGTGAVFNTTPDGTLPGAAAGEEAGYHVD